MVAPDGVVKVLDFGLARPGSRCPRRGEVTLHGSTIPGAARSAPPIYMAPERIAQGPLDPRSDLFFAWASSCMKMATGRLPFCWRLSPVRDGHEYLRQGAGPAPGFCHHAAPRPLARVIERLLSKRAEDRYPSATALLEALDARALAIATFMESPVQSQ